MQYSAEVVQLVALYVPPPEIFKRVIIHAGMPQPQTKKAAADRRGLRCQTRRPQAAPPIYSTFTCLVPEFWNSGIGSVVSISTRVEPIVAPALW